MVLTRDALSAPADASNANGSLPYGTDAGLPDGDTFADTRGVDGADEAASPDATSDDVDPFADIPPDLLTQHREAVVAEQEALWRERVGDVHRIKNGELKGVNKVNVRLRAELAARDEYIRQHAQDWGLNEGDLAILTNKVRTAGDGAEARYAAVTERFDQQTAWATSRLEENLKEFFGEAGQRSYQPNGDATFQSLWNEAHKQLGQWVMAGEPEDARFVGVQRAFDNVKAHLQRQAGGARPVTAASNGKTPPPSAAQRAAAQQRGPAAPARTGGTGRGMTEDRAWEQARSLHPTDPRKAFREALRLQEGQP